MPMLSPKEAFQQAQQVYEEGRYRSALKMTETLYRQMPHHPPVVVLHVSVLLRLQRAEPAAAIAQRAIRTITNNWHRTLMLTNLAEALNQLKDFDGAVGVLSDELAKRPDDAYLISALAQILVIQNKHGEALTLTGDAIARGITHLGVVTGFGRAAVRTDRRDEAIALIEAALAAPDVEQVAPSTRSSAYTVLGHLYDKSKDYARAFAAYENRNNLHPKTYDDQQVIDRIASLESVWTPEAFVGVQRPTPSGPRPVFIIGMPRSGTTLTEQILDMHPRAFGAGELEGIAELARQAVAHPNHVFSTGPEGYDLDTLQRLGDEYRAELMRLAGGREYALITDKAPTNYWHMGLIALALPDAKFVHCMRDPRDTCLSCLFQPLDPSHAFSFDMDSCGRYYRHYHAYVQHMTGVMRDPRVGIDVLEMRYEDTVSDQEAQTRRLLDFVGLEFHEDCLNFHRSERVAMTLSNDQVRSPIYQSSTRRYERYAAHIGPLIEALGDLVPADERVGDIH
ncbi:MAG: sulfotransferase [Phycisphaerales bacterium]|nr:sulfotransferase [Phycisphaerales bacterium]